MKHVHNDLHVIEHDPLARRKSVNRHWAQIMIDLEPPLNFARDRFQVRLGRAGADYEKIGKGRNTLEVEDDNLLRFLVRREVSASLG